MRQTYRSRSAFVMAWFWLAFVAFNVYDLIHKYSGKASMVALAVLAVLTAVVYVVALRPATVFTERELVARNPLRTVRVPWAAIEDVTVSHAIGVHHGDDQVLRLWTPMSSARERAKAQRRGLASQRRGRFQTEPALSKAEQAAQEALAGRTHADWVGEQIRERAEAARRRHEEAAPVQASWAYDAVAAGVAALALVVVAIVVP
ncbi:PH domain-containing protein [Actinomadura sp. ATCC 31491]|uniref:PH domain-containing protein n=1 Tax=Actinomadura luzonensis TaxID=2805427 RepID=A0ABT0G9U7_9ACTN|nr:PH domain-containing protein [Actinomadura luzonensis]MCK2221361.1 PH domain-containing protein [Actinomadura luzonensis]